MKNSEGHGKGRGQSWMKNNLLFTMIQPLLNVLQRCIIYLLDKFGDNFCAASLKSFFFCKFVHVVYFQSFSCVTYFI